MKDRGMIKWIPFNSVIPGQVILNNIDNAKKRIKKPLLDEDQQVKLNDDLFSNYYTQSEVLILYFYDGSLYKIKGVIKRIDTTKKEVIVNNLLLHTSQIMAIKEI